MLIVNAEAEGPNLLQEYIKLSPTLIPWIVPQ